jgi:NAD(P)H-dependent FMN reductase
VKLMIVIASTRPGRVGLPVAQWFDAIAREHDGFDDVELADLLELDLPMMDEPNHPRFHSYTKQHTKDWSAKVAAGFTAPLKNAIDYLHVEWRYKPVGFVSYGGVAAGTRAVQMLKQVVTTLKMTPIFEAVSIPFVAQLIDDDGAVQANETMQQAAGAMLAELARVGAALAPLRAEQA